MHLNLILKNWRSINHAEINLGPFTLLVGRNSTGKSNIVDALLFFFEISRDAELAVSKRGGIESIRRWSPTKPYDITVDVRATSATDARNGDHVRHEFVLGSGKDGAWNFKKERIEAIRNGERVAHLDRLKNRVEFTVGGRGLELDDFSPTSSAMSFARSSFYAGRRENQQRFPVVRILRPVPDLMRRPQPPSESLRLSENAENITTALHRMKSDEGQKIVKAMKRIIPGLIDIRAIPTGRYLSLGFDQEQADQAKAHFVATEMSDGALRALAIVTAAMQMRQGEFLIIEEPEANLHPGAADVVYDVLHAASDRGGVLVTTHSPEILDRASGEEILVCDYVDGVTQVGKLASPQRELVKNGLFTVAELMRSDELRREGSEPSVVRDAE